MKKVISLFTGAGGLDYGIEKAGFKTVIAIEMDKWCCETLRSNRGNWNIIEDKIENVSSEKILSTASLKKGEAKLLIGGPPCQPFSKSSYWVHGDSKRLSDKRANTLIEYMRVLNDTLPDSFILENVFGLAYKEKDEGLRYLNDELKSINQRNKVKYSFSWKVLNTADFGVPQIRERVFIVGSKNGKTFKFPEPQFFPNEDIQSDLFNNQCQSYRTAWDAIGDLEEECKNTISLVGGKWGELLPTIPPGENYLYHSERGKGKPLFKWRSRYWSFLLKLHPDKPSWTIQAQPGTAIGPFHWNNRRLTMREMARIQTFPEEIMIKGGISNVQKQLGNAVPSLMAELLGKSLSNQFFNSSYKLNNLELCPPKRSGSAKFHIKTKIPNKYFEEICLKAA